MKAIYANLDDHNNSLYKETSVGKYLIEKELSF